MNHIILKQIKSHAKYSYLLHLICGNQRFEIHKINGVNPVYLIINKVSGYFEEINGNKYLTSVPTNKSKEKLKKYEEMWSKIRNLIRSAPKNSYGYDKNI